MGDSKKGENVRAFFPSQLKVISLCYRYIYREVRSTKMALTLTASTVVASVKPTVSSTRRYVRVVFARFPKCFVFLRALWLRGTIFARERWGEGGATREGARERVRRMLRRSARPEACEYCAFTFFSEPYRCLALSRFRRFG